MTNHFVARGTRTAVSHMWQLQNRYQGCAAITGNHRFCLSALRKLILSEVMVQVWMWFYHCGLQMKENAPFMCKSKSELYRYQSFKYTTLCNGSQKNRTCLQMSLCRKGRGPPGQLSTGLLRVEFWKPTENHLKRKNSSILMPQIHIDNYLTEKQPWFCRYECIGYPNTPGHWLKVVKWVYGRILKLQFPESANSARRTSWAPGLIFFLFRDISWLFCIYWSIWRYTVAFSRELDGGPLHWVFET